jgi:hypothetical protein
VIHLPTRWTLNSFQHRWSMNSFLLPWTTNLSQHPFSQHQWTTRSFQHLQHPWTTKSFQRRWTVKSYHHSSSTTIMLLEHAIATFLMMMTTTRSTFGHQNSIQIATDHSLLSSQSDCYNRNLGYCCAYRWHRTYNDMEFQTGKSVSSTVKLIFLACNLVISENRFSLELMLIELPNSLNSLFDKRPICRLSINSRLRQTNYRLCIFSVQTNEFGQDRSKPE